MKKIIGVLFVLILSIMGIFFVGCSASASNDEYLRIHIRANSNEEVDQGIKYKIKQEVVSFLTPIIANCSNKNEMILSINNNISSINGLCDDLLRKNGLNYTANTKINNEYFPTRNYGELTLSQGYYDALIVELGEAKGDNWWCVVYPPLCFVNAKEINGKNFRYKSKIVELIKNWK